SRPNATRQLVPSPGSRSPTPRIVTPVSRNPAAVWIARAEPAVPGGASSEIAVENWAESATTVTPQTTASARVSAGGAPNRKPTEIAQLPERAIAIIVSV